MAGTWYNKSLTKIMKALVDLSSVNLKFALVTAGYTFSQSDAFVTDLGANIVERTANLTSVTVGSVGEGVLDAADSTFTALTGSVGTQLILFHDTGTDSTSQLLLMADSSEYTGLPITPDGSDVPLVFPAAGIGKIVGA